MGCQMVWIKIATGMFDDEKILMIESLPEGDSIIAIWFKMLCLAGKQNNDGVFILNNRIPYTDEMFATIFRRPVNVIRMAIKAFEDFGMVEVINNTVTIPHWSDYQGSEKLDAAKESIRKRVEKYRSRQRALIENDISSKNDGLSNSCNEKSVTCNVTATPDVTLQPVTCNVTVTPCNADRIRIRNRIRDDVDVDDNYIDTACVREDDGTPTDNTADDLAMYFQRAYINLTSGNWEMLRQVCEQGGFDGQIICYAIDCTVAIASNRFSTVLKILSSWAANGVHTVEDAKRFEEQRQRNAYARHQQQQRGGNTESNRGGSSTPEFY